MNLHVYKLKSAAGRVSAFLGAVGFVGAMVSAALPGIASADALNPLTERSLMLSSSSPGWAYTDGSGNGTFAQPGQGANGQKTGETFSFKVSTDSTSLPIQAFTLQYCTGAAGICTGPGNDTIDQHGTPGDTSDDTRNNDDDSHSDLNVHYTSAVQNTDFEIWSNGVKDTSGDWDMAVDNVETNPTALALTGRNNFITLSNSGTSLVTPAATQEIQIIFKASANNYITNPGAGAFFVRLNTFSDEAATDFIDGGVTVANVMNRSIWITTKVLETMSFSVGTVNPDTVVLSSGTHGSCDPITTNDRIQMGDSTAEYSLSTFTPYDANSYWRLATNSGSGATVYYSGETLNNTVGDSIEDISSDSGSPNFTPIPAKAHFGTEQFGLAFNDESADTVDTGHGAVASSISPLTKGAAYASGTGTINAPDWTDNTALFYFKKSSNDTPEPIASNTSDVLDCSTAKMRYVADISPSTPAGVYTTKINYIAAPRY